MPVTVIVGCQWGDEGKGKVVDQLSRRVDWVARFSGGHNAGHTVRFGKEQVILHLIPCGILQKRPRCVIGHGVVIDPAHLVSEMDLLTGRGIPLEGRLFLSDSAHVVMPYHRWLEVLDGQDTRIGTTRRGIGPAYQDKAARIGIRMGDLLDAKRLRSLLEQQIQRLEERFRAAGEAPPLPLDQALMEWSAQYGGIAHRLRPFVTDTLELLHQAVSRGERVLCEGAQGFALDLDMGTYPYVTSSSTAAGGAATGLGLPPSVLRKVVGVCKAYTTRVGEGPFPTEIAGEAGELLRRRGGEYGATTGRPRRVGWLDIPALRQAVRVSGITGLFLTKIDVLSGDPVVRIATAYRTPGGERLTPPMDAAQIAACEPVYEEVPGWEGALGSIRRFVDLPEAARSYVRRVEDLAGCRVQWVSVGSSRSAVVSVPGLR